MFIYITIVLRSLLIPYTGDAWHHPWAPKEGSTRFLLCFLGCLFSCLSGRYLSHPLSWEAEIWGQKWRYTLAKTYFYLLINQLIDNFLIIIDLFITYLFSFSSGQYVRHLLSLKVDIWTWHWTSDLAIKGVFDLLINYFFWWINFQKVTVWVV